MPRVCVQLRAQDAGARPDRLWCDCAIVQLCNCACNCALWLHAAMSSQLHVESLLAASVEASALDEADHLLTVTFLLPPAALFTAMALESWLVYFLGTLHLRHQRMRVNIRAVSTTDYFLPPILASGRIASQAAHRCLASLEGPMAVAAFKAAGAAQRGAYKQYTEGEFSVDLSALVSLQRISRFSLMSSLAPTTGVAHSLQAVHRGGDQRASAGGCHRVQGSI